MSGPLTSSDDVLKKLRAVLEPHGVFLRGVVNFVSGDKAPILNDGQAAASIVLLGNIGRSIWPAFERWRGVPANKDAQNPLDTWSKAVIEPVALEIRRNRLFPVRSALAAFPAVGDARRRSTAVASRHSHPSGIRPVARLSWGTRLWSRSSRRTASPPCASLRHLFRQALPFRLSGGCCLDVGFSDCALPHAPENGGRQDQLHDRRVPCPKPLSCRHGVSLSAGTAAFSYGCAQFVVFQTSFCFCRLAGSDAA